ncbi:MAG: selenocysteine-specific translation elongation factor [Firmicutes bacterium]|nr:selenocysteine-specific translation elongation factor [Bacillota bacterium]
MNKQNYTIIGTAGHVDHGKTTLIKALTGIDTDKLKEEKKRGITIELGYAYLDLPNGQKAGIIDVPGHEKFIKNMLAGASTISLALIIIAADEGIMPQTREHLDILSLLSIKKAVIALTKADTVEIDWLDMAKEEIRTELDKNYTFIKNAEIIPVSAHTGYGMDSLKKSLFNLAQNAAGHPKASAPFRLPINKTFSSDGFGTVVTGTVTDGSISVGDEVILYPKGISSKIRFIQNHAKKVDTIYTGQRAAINLGGISLEQVQKGDTIAIANSMRAATKIDVKINVLSSCNREIIDKSKLHFHSGTANTLAKLLLFDRTSLKKGESAYAQLLLDEPMTLRFKDKFVLRFYSPLETVAGGVVLDTEGARYKKGEDLAAFKIKDEGGMRERIERVVYERQSINLADLRTRLFDESAEFDKEMAYLIKAEKMFLMAGAKGETVIGVQFLKSLSDKLIKILDEYLNKNPLVNGMPKAKLNGIDNKILEIMHNLKLIKFEGDAVKRVDFVSSVGVRHQRICDGIEKRLKNSGFTTPSLDDLRGEFINEGKFFKESFDMLVSDKKVVMLTAQVMMSGEYYQKALDIFKELFKNGPVVLGDFRDKLGTSRKYALALLEHFDLKKITKMIEDARVLC